MQNDTILIIGLGPQGLFLQREFARNGYRIITISKKDEIGFYSKYGQKISIKNHSELKNKLIKISRNKNISECHVTSGFYLSYLIDKFSELWDIYNVYPGPFDVVNLFNEKMETYNVVSKHGINTLKSHLLTDFNNNILNIEYPQIIKWNISQKNSLGFKTKIIETPKQLYDIKSSINEKYHKDLLCQKYLDPNNYYEILYGAYLLDGKIIADLLMQEISHYPMGIASEIIEFEGIRKKHILELNRNFLEFFKYSGFIELEYKYNIKNNSLVLFEINPRIWGSAKILKRKYPNIINVINSHETIDNDKTSCQWVNILRNLLYTANNLSIKNIINFIKSMNGSIYDVFDKKDLKPFFYQVVKGLRR